MMNHNQNITTRKFELQAFVDVINTADAYKLSRLSKYERSSFYNKISYLIHVSRRV
jgi:glutamate receptor 3